MDRDTIISLLTKKRDHLFKLGVRSLALFGSVARGEANPNSDVDLLVDMEPPYTFDRYIQTKFFLEDLLECSVDLVISDTLKPQVRPGVEKEAIRVA
jgi:uncharacterized protein